VIYFVGTFEGFTYLEDGIDRPVVLGCSGTSAYAPAALLFKWAATIIISRQKKTSLQNIPSTSCETLLDLLIMVEECRILVMASGKGSNFKALRDAIASDQIPNCRITRLIVNRQKAPAIEIAKQASIPWEYFNLITHGFQTKSENDPGRLLEARHAYDTALARKILDGNPRPHLIILAGWMYVFGEHFLDPLYAEGIKIINLHPALPGLFLYLP
jgi:hypothetical protein